MTTSIQCRSININCEYVIQQLPDYTIYNQQSITRYITASSINAIM